MKLRIEKAVYGGAGLAHQTEGLETGRAIFVPFTLPGEIVDANLVEQKDGFDEASLVEILTVSEDRIQPKCAHFGLCGGCQYQHATYEAQVQMKVEILQETLERANLTSLPQIRALSGEPWTYRNRTRLRIAEIDSAARLGYNRRGSNQFLPIHECPILAPILWRAASAILQLADEEPRIASWIRSLSEIEFFTTNDEKNLQMTVFAAKHQPGFKDLCNAMQKRLPELTSAAALLLPSAPQRRAQSPRQLETWGAAGIIYQAAGEDYWISRGGFFQVNRYLIDDMVRIATGNRQGTTAWDLYAGVGLFSRALTKRFQQVVAVEAAGDDLVNSFKGPGRRAVAATTAEFLRGAVVQRDRPQLIVMDPPRAGVGAEVCALLAKIAAPEIVYVSCDPVTLARDLKSLVASGYKVDELTMVDMFPQTFHLETICVLRR
jgi:23S rRNA (uracil1939-C5)-methyltransferase